ncbi:hypothetical protein QWY87_03985 [Lutimonas halocynthiae]|uniref:hypothetical protein n=1 Tax=Lutimonas halocynthiae TaxID=1446477 RepID=UPI0025B479A6|nr:hypothetical protein [Lutimonas halocynthiae]MDN3641846.1 hypothetical protein [Lutimonas halocynthiae]
MKKAILLSFLILIFSCSNDNDDDFITIQNDFVTTPDVIGSQMFELNISQSDGTSITSCPEVGDVTYLIKDNSTINGVLGKYGNLEVSTDNTIFVYSCSFSSTENNDFIVQRFGGMLTTVHSESINLEGRLEINRQTRRVSGAITINIINSNDSKTYDVIGNIHESGSCEIESYSRRKS